MAEWKKIVTSGSNGLSISALDINLGAESDGNLTLPSTTTVQSAIDQLNNVVGILAPSAPDGLSEVGLSFLSTAMFSARNQNFNQVFNLTVDTTPQVRAQDFFDGSNGTLSASISTDGGSNFTEIGNVALTSGINNGTYNQLIISNNVDANEEFPNIISGFYDILTAQISPTGLTANSVNNYDRTILKLVHSTTGEATSPSFTIINNPSTNLSTLSFSYNESINRFHYQSGIKYLGNHNGGDGVSTISASYEVNIDSNANFINNDGKLSLLTATNFDARAKTINESWIPGESFPVTSSMPVQNNKFQKGSVFFRGFNYKADDNNINAQDVFQSLANVLIDSKQEDETRPNNGASFPLRVTSGETQYPSFGTGISNFGDTFNSETNISSSGYELQFSSESYHWPAGTNYTNYIPSGPDYTGISGDDNNNNLRYTTFNLGSIDASGFTIVFKSVFGFDSAALQSEDNFQLSIRVMDGSTPVTNWLDANAGYGGGTPTAEGTGIVVVANSSTTVSNGGDYVRVLTFGEATRVGTLFVRVGWSNSGGTDATSTSTRKFKYIYKI